MELKITRTATAVTPGVVAAAVAVTAPVILIQMMKNAGKLWNGTKV